MYSIFALNSEILTASAEQGAYFTYAVTKINHETCAQNLQIYQKSSFHSRAGESKAGSFFSRERVRQADF
jgi:hypothetical protein